MVNSRKRKNRSVYSTEVFEHGACLYVEARELRDLKEFEVDSLLKNYIEEKNKDETKTSGQIKSEWIRIRKSKQHPNAFVYFQSKEQAAKFSDLFCDARLCQNWTQTLRVRDGAKVDKTDKPVQQQTELPKLCDLMQKKLTDDSTLRSRVAPLAKFSYPDQLEIKQVFIKDAMKRLCRSLYMTHYSSTFPPTKSCRPKAKKRKTGDQVSSIVSDATSAPVSSKTMSPLTSESSISVQTPCSEDQEDETDDEWSSVPMPENYPWCGPRKARGFHGIDVEPIIGSSAKSRTQYRNKCDFTISEVNSTNPHQPFAIGFVVGSVREGVHSVAEPYGLNLLVPNCMQEVVHCLTKTILDKSVLSKWKVCDRNTRTGVWRMLMLRTNPSTKSILICLQIQQIKDDRIKLDEIKSFLIDTLTSREFDHHKVASISIQQSDRSSDSFDIDEPTECIFGNEHISVSLCGCRFNIRPKAFLQVNFSSASLLYDKVFEFLLFRRPEPQPHDICESEKQLPKIILDVCCGSGTIGICLMKKIISSNLSQSELPKVIGIDISEDAINTAAENARMNDVSTAEYFCGRAENVLPVVLGQIKSTDQSVVAVVDPPRCGLHPSVIKALRECQQLTRIIYVSCNVKTLLQNSVELCAEDPLSNVAYRPLRAVGVDMFPHTYHTECICLFEKKVSFQ